MGAVCGRRRQAPPLRDRMSSSRRRRGEAVAHTTVDKCPITLPREARRTGLPVILAAASIQYVPTGYATLRLRSPMKRSLSIHFVSFSFFFPYGYDSPIRATTPMIFYLERAPNQDDGWVTLSNLFGGGSSMFPRRLDRTADVDICRARRKAVFGTTSGRLPPTNITTVCQNYCKAPRVSTRKLQTLPVSSRTELDIGRRFTILRRLMRWP